MRRRAFLRCTALAPLVALAARHLGPSWRLGYALAFDRATGLFVRVRP